MRSVLAATYAVLREGREGEDLDSLNVRLGLEEEEESPMPEHGSTFGGELLHGDFGQGGDVVTVA